MKKPKSGVYVEGLTKVIATTANELDRIKTKGSENRKVGEYVMLSIARMDDFMRASKTCVQG